MSLHKGIIWAESDGEGRGAVFSVKLPIDDVSEIAVYIRQF